MPSLRTKEMKEKYQEYLRNNPQMSVCPICDKPSVRSFKHWKVTANEFPYDLIAKTHHMILPLRHVPESGLTPEEEQEFKFIKQSFIGPEYDYIIEATPKNKSLPDHFHIHLLIAK